MYGKNAFKLYLYTNRGLCLKRSFTKANRRRMRFLLLTAQHRCQIREISPYNTMWSSIILTLNILCLVTEQPVQKTYQNALPLKKEIESQLRFIQAFLNCFHQLLEGKVLEVDFNRKLETAEVVKECMLGGYCEVQCRLSSDLMFQRGRFLYNLGYWDNDDHGFSLWDV